MQLGLDPLCLLCYYVTTLIFRMGVVLWRGSAEMRLKVRECCLEC